jgi:methyl-accepting chemotaxis protein
MIFRKSITAKFLAALFVILLIGQAAGALIQIFSLRASLLESLENRISREGAIAAGVSAPPLMNGEYGLLDSPLEEIMKDGDIVSVHILDKEGKVVKEHVRAADTENSALTVFYNQDLSSRTPVYSAGAKIGEVVIDYATKSINGSLLENIVTISLYELIMLFSVGVIMMVLFNRNIKKPVSEINSAVEKITLGDLSAEVPDLGENEIGSIARGVAFLAERFSLTVSRLNSTAVNVSMAIKQVDVTYKNVIAGSQRQGSAVKEIMKSVQHANTAQSEISESSERLAGLSTENLSSLIELKATAEEIASNNQRLFKATEDSYSVVAEMTHTAKAISKNAAEALSAVEDTSASVEEIGASIREVEENARQSSRAAETVKEITSDTGMLAIVNAVEGMDNISAEVKKSAEIVRRLGTRSSDIEKVLSVIKDVTEQTNLLSLNAAILAAQAGEYGKSFSVVADEIRGLSERTASSTREIGGIVKTIQRDIKDAVSSIESARNKVDEGNGLVVKVGDALKEILTASEHSAEMTKAIERATEEQSLGLRQITSAIEDIRKIMHSVANSTREQDNALSYLLDGVGDVKEVADLSKRGTEEQAIGTRGISKNLEMANEGITKISEAVLNQKMMNDSIVHAMEQIGDIGAATVKDMEEVSYSLKTLFEEIEVLKKEMEAFRVK